MFTHGFAQNITLATNKQNFAQLDNNNNVINIITASSDFINSLSNSSSYVEMSKNGSIRYNFAVIGGTFDITNNAFISPSPYPSWTLNTSTFKWQPPIPKPAKIAGSYWIWDESTKNWVSMTIPAVTTNNASK